MIANALPPWLFATMLMSLRLGTAWAMSPAMSAYRVPAFVRLVLVLALAVVSSAGIDAAPSPRWATDSGCFEAIVSEVLVGLFLGLGVHVALSAFALAGRLLDVQIGFGIASIFDPVSRNASSVMGALLGLIGVALFFVTDAHLALARMVVLSTRVLPLGSVPDIGDGMSALTAVGALFATGLALAAPVVVALLLCDLLVGLATRNLPQVNVLALSLPVKILVGYFVLAVAVRGWAPVIERSFGQVADVWGARP